MERVNLCIQHSGGSGIKNKRVAGEDSTLLSWLLAQRSVRELSRNVYVITAGKWDMETRIATTTELK